MAFICDVLGTKSYAYHCITCGVAFTVPQIVADRQAEVGGYHHCPNGHSQGWAKDGSENAKLTRERDRLKQQNARLEMEAAAAKRETEAERAKVQRLARRAKAGSCPCCKRTFSNMTRHMRLKHPDFGSIVPLKATS